MKLTIQKILGDIGEAIATLHLQNNGFTIARADRINHIGHSVVLKNKPHF